MFVGEFGVDAFHGRCLGEPPTGFVNEAEQRDWTLALWNDIARNLSAQGPDNVAVGGFVFSWNDEWWKVPLPGSQQTGGWTSDGFPDWHGSEEFFGITSVGRMPRQVYDALRMAFAPTYEPPAHETTFRAISRGANMCGPQANFRRDGWTFFQRLGANGGGRGFNVAVSDVRTGAIIETGRNFDTWGGGPSAKNDLVAYLQSIPNGRLVMLAVADEAGLNPGPANACAMLTDPATRAVVQTLESLGSSLIRSYCWRGSWAVVIIKGAAPPLAEDYQLAEEARAEASVPTAEPPSAAADAYSTPFQTVLNVSSPGVLTNDRSDGGGSMTAQLSRGAANGVISLSPDGSFTYTPNPGFSGVDSFAYQVSNAVGPGSVATATITVPAPTPAPPINFRVVSMEGNAVTFAWVAPVAPPAPTGFRLEGGLVSGQVLGSVPLGVQPGVSVSLPSASWYVRAITDASGVLSAPSNEVLVHVNQALTPSAPTNLLGVVVGNAVHLSWKNSLEGSISSGGRPTSVQLNVSGSVDTALPLTLSESFSFGAVPAGTYTFTVQARNSFGVSAASEPLNLTFPSVCTGPPEMASNFVAYRSGGIVSLFWDPPRHGPAPTEYLLNVSGSFSGSFPMTRRSFSSPVPPGTYHLSITSTNPCGVAAPTPIQTISF
jgi:hypothetical protein